MLMTRSQAPDVDALRAPGDPPSCMILCKAWHLIYLCERMRADEIEQYVALSGHDRYDPEAAMREFLNLPGHKFTVVEARSGLPAAAGGYHEVFPGVWQSWMVGTQQGWDTSWRSLTKATRWVMDYLFDHGARRLQTNALASRTKAIEWYTHRHGLQMRPCGVWEGYGRNGEAVAHFERLHPNTGEL